MRKIKHLTYIITLVLICSFALFSQETFAAGGTGTPDDPYIIETADELRALSGTTINSYYQLGADIDLGGTNWTPITSQTSAGVFDGAGHTITGFKLSSGAGFIATNSGTVKNINFTGVNVTSNAADVGTVVGVNNRSGIVENINVNGTCSSNSWGSGVHGRGGIVGYNYGTIDYCSFSGSISYTYNVVTRIGGICGFHNSGVIRNCANYATVTSSSNNVGGIAGESNTYNSGSTPIIENCYNWGAVKGNAQIGGIVGWNAPGIVKNCYNAGKTTHTNSNSGSLAGNSTNGSVIHSYGVIGGSNNSTDNLVAYSGTVTNCSKVNNNETDLATMADNLNDWIDQQSDPSKYKRWNYGDGREYPTFDPGNVTITFKSGDNGDFGTDSETQDPITEIKVITTQGTTWDAAWVPSTLDPNEGYEFDRWDSDFPDTVDSDLTITALWKIKKCKITFVDEDGTTVLKDEVEYDYGTPAANIDKPEDPTKPSTTEHTYTFAGWDPTISEVSGNVTYIATYTETTRTYTVTWKNDDGTVLETDENVAYGATPEYNGETPTKQATAQYSYTFAGWDPAVSEVSGDATYKATYTPTTRTYTVTWINDDEDETVLETDTGVAYGENPSYDGVTPTKSATAQYNYTFTGWTPAIDTVKGDVTYKATYQETLRKYKVKFVDEDGSTVIKDEVEYEYGTPAASIEKPADPTKPSTAEHVYPFTGWSPEISEVKGDATYTATYGEEVRTYTVTWVNDGGTVLETDTGVEYGTMPSYGGETPTKSPTAQYTYTFAGWNPEISAVSADVTYTATYTSTTNSYTIIWKNYDGSVLETDENVEYGKLPYYNGDTPTKEETEHYTYTFIGWTPEIAEVMGNATYTAVFKEVGKQSTLTFNLNGGKLDGKEGSVEILANYGTKITIPDAPVRDGYDFQYWKGSEYYPGDKYLVEGDHTFTAEWKKSGGGSGDDPSDDDDSDDDDNSGDNNKSSDNGNKKSSGKSSKGVNTADESELILWILILALSTMTTIGTHIIRRREDYR